MQVSHKTVVTRFSAKFSLSSRWCVLLHRPKPLQNCQIIVALRLGVREVWPFGGSNERICFEDIFFQFGVRIESD